MSTHGGALELGCKIAINCDAHDVHGMEIAEFGIGTARRGWVTAADVVNTLPLDCDAGLSQRCTGKGWVRWLDSVAAGLIADWRVGVGRM